jgi:hypothetical protein
MAKRVKGGQNLKSGGVANIKGDLPSCAPVLNRETYFYSIPSRFII